MIYTSKLLLFTARLIVINTVEVKTEGFSYKKKQDATHRPRALTGIGGGSLDFMLRFRVVTVQGVGIRWNGIITL